MSSKMSRKLLAVTLTVAAQSVGAWADDQDKPGRGVARISLINGDVSVRRGDSGDWVAAAINAPMVVQDRMLTGEGSRAEIQFDYANMIRLSGDSEARLSDLENRRYQVQVARGTTTFRVLRDSEADVEISTPQLSVRPLKRGVYRVTVLADGSSEVTVRSGEAEIFTPAGSQRLKAGKTMLARGTSSDPEFRVTAEINDDNWDRWNERRDRDLERSASYRYVSRDIYGAEDLDDHGRWVYVAPYGNVWVPQVSVGWAPYRYGRWSWIDWYGWSWVSYDPWGWAPYHYGRWFHHGQYGWSWWPGAVYSRHYWRPGLVAFFGWNNYSGFNVGVGFGFGRVGWCPLGPYEPYYPWYGHGYYGGYRNRNYIDNSVNIVNNVNVTNIYRNSRVANAITAVDGNDFNRGRASNHIRVSDSEISRASLVRGQLPQVPDRESLRLADRDARVSRPEREGGEGRFYSRQPAASVDRVPFEDQRRGVQEVSRRTFGEPAARGAESPRVAEAQGGRRGESGSARTAEGAPPSRTSEPDRGGWRRFGEPIRGGSSGREADAGVVGGGGRTSEATRSEGTRSEGWRRMGEPAVRGSEPSRQNEPSRQEQGTRSESWRRFGDRSGDEDRSGVLNRRSESGRTPESGRGEVFRRNESTPRTESPRMESPRQRESSPRFEQRREDPVRISPPIVRERSGGRDDGGSRRGPEPGVGGGRGGFERAPSAPQSRGGDGGGARGGGGSPPSRGGDGGGARGGDGGGGRSGGGESRGGGRVR